MLKFILFSLGIHLLIIWRLSPAQLITAKQITKHQMIFMITPSTTKSLTSPSPTVSRISSKKVVIKKHSANGQKIYFSKVKSGTDTNSPHVHNGLGVVSLPLSYPSNAIKNRLEGNVIVEIKIKQGKIKHGHIVKSSGHQILDRAVITALKRATLKNKKINTKTMTLAFRFKLKIQ